MGSKEKADAPVDERSLLAKICDGGPNPVVALACAPAVLPYRAATAYLTPCLGAYGRTLARAISRRLCCCLAGYYTYEDTKWCGNVAIGSDKEHHDCDWVRVEELSAGSEDKPMVLYQGEIEPRDCVQGALGDCWLVAALACLAEHPGAIHRLILNQQASIRGKYQVRLWDGRAKKWVIVTVDDKIPCKRGTKDPIYMKPHNNEFWPLIVEKAMAKFLGSYGDMDGGHGTWATHTLTGDNVFMLKKKPGQSMWKRSNMKFIMRKDAKRDSIYHEEDKDEISRDKLFNILEQYDNIRSLISCAKIAKNGESADRATGLVEGHLFSVISVRRAGRSFGVGGRKFVKLRNPWSKFEWKGAWSDGSKEWAENPSIAKELNHEDKDDGIFWMSFDDFVDYFNQISICDRTTKYDLSLRYDHDHPYVGPVQGCVKGCVCFWCLCQGPRHVYCGHTSSTDTREAKACGCIKIGNE